MLTQEYEMVDLASSHLKTHPQNPNIGDTQAIAKSISRSGFYGYILAQRSTGHILAGNHRYQAAVSRGATQLPVLWIDCDDRVALKILLADNRTADLGSTNDAQLADLLRELDIDPGGLGGSGYTHQDYEAVLSRLEFEQGAGSSGAGASQGSGDRGVSPVIVVGGFLCRTTPESFDRLATELSRECGADEDAIEKLVRTKLGLPV